MAVGPGGSDGQYFVYGARSGVGNAHRLIAVAAETEADEAEADQHHAPGCWLRNGLNAQRASRVRTVCAVSSAIKSVHSRAVRKKVELTASDPEVQASIGHVRSGGSGKSVVIKEQSVGRSGLKRLARVRNEARDVNAVNLTLCGQNVIATKRVGHVCGSDVDAPAGWGIMRTIGQQERGSACGRNERRAAQKRRSGKCQKLIHVFSLFVKNLLKRSNTRANMLRDCYITIFSPEKLLEEATCKPR